MEEDRKHFLKGQKFWKNGDVDNAIKEFEIAATTGEDLPVEHLALAQALEKKKATLKKHYQSGNIL